MLKMAIIGDKDSVLAFKAFDVDIYASSTIEEARESWQKIAKDSYGIVLITEPYYMQMQDLLEKVAAEPIPTILSIPSTTGSKGYAVQRIRTIVQKAIGTDLLTEKEE